MDKKSKTPEAPKPLDQPKQPGSPTNSMNKLPKDTQSLKTLVLYQKLLFIFPAGALISHSNGLLDQAPTNTSFALAFLLFSFVIIEYASTSGWINQELESSENSYMKFGRRTLLYCIDLVRIVSLTIFFIAVSNAHASPSSDATKFAWLSLGVFLLCNLIWNLVLTPVHKAAMGKFLQSLEDKKNRVDDSFHEFGPKAAIHFVNWFYKVGWLFLYFIFPFAGLLFVLMSPEINDDSIYNGPFGWIFQNPMDAFLYIFSAQFLLKFPQVILIDHMYNKVTT